MKLAVEFCWLRCPSIRRANLWQGASPNGSFLQKLPGTARCLPRRSAAKDGKEKIVWIQTRSKVDLCHDQRRENSRLGRMTASSGQHDLCRVSWMHHKQANSCATQDVLTSALEAGLSTLLFDSVSTELQEEWSQIGRFTALTVSEDGEILEDCRKVYSRFCLLSFLPTLMLASRSQEQWHMICALI